MTEKYNKNSKWLNLITKWHKAILWIRFRYVCSRVESATSYYLQYIVSWIWIKMYSFEFQHFECSNEETVGWLICMCVCLLHWLHLKVSTIFNNIVWWASKSCKSTIMISWLTMWEYNSATEDINNSNEWSSCSRSRRCRCRCCRRRDNNQQQVQSENALAVVVCWFACVFYVDNMKIYLVPFVQKHLDIEGGGVNVWN